jgi:hypothetical protein
MTVVLTTPGSAFMQINFLLLAGTVSGLVLFYRGFGLLQRKRLIQDVPLSNIRSAALGLVEVSGTVSGKETLLSPLCQVDCYFYQVTAYRLSGSSGEFQRWKKVAEESLSVPFCMDDGTGKLLVDAEGAELEIPPDYSGEEGGEQYGGRGGIGPRLAAAMNPEISVSDAVAHFLARHGISHEGRVKVEERSVKAGDRLFIVGTVAENIRGQVESETAERTAYLSASAAQVQRDVVLSTSLPSSERKLIASTPHAAPPDSTEPATEGQTVVLMKGSNNPTFFISTFSQQQVLGELKWKTPLYIFGGPALTMFCLWNLFSRFGVI